MNLKDRSSHAPKHNQRPNMEFSSRNQSKLNDSHINAVKAVVKAVEAATPPPKLLILFVVVVSAVVEVELEPEDEPTESDKASEPSIPDNN